MRTLTEKAYQCIKEGIVRGEIEEGVFLSEKQIMKRYQIGRTPFREACNRLHHEQLLEVVPRRGYLVPQMSLQEVRDLFEVRVLVEGAIAELAAVRATEREIEELAQLADQSLPPLLLARERTIAPSSTPRSTCGWRPWRTIAN